MKVYLDSKDIIQILERSDPFSKEEFEAILSNGNHELVLSFITVMEISQPLLYENASSNVCMLLNQIEELPHTFIHSSPIFRLELEEAFRAFSNESEYNNISPPFSNRFDTVVDIHGNPATKLYLRYSLAEIVWDLHSGNALKDPDVHAENLRKFFEADRALDPKPSLEESFTITLERHTKRYNLEIPKELIKDMFSWIYNDPNRCPSIRLAFELWHKMTKNTTDTPKDSDLNDMNNISHLPYVDTMTVDKRMYEYISQVIASLQVDYGEKVFKKVQEMTEAF